MTGHSFFGKQKLCYTEVTDFTDFQGIGRDPMYKRYDSVFSVVKRTVPVDIQNFLATPEYISDTDQICWHVPQWTEHPIRLSELDGSEFERYKCIFDDTVNKYKQGVMNLNGEDLMIMAGAIKYIDNERTYCADGKVYAVAWGMTPDTKQHKVIGSVIHDFDFVKKYKIIFEPGEHGKLESKIDRSISRAEGTVLSELDVPKIVSFDGWSFDGWEQNPIGQIITSDMTFTARYSESPISIIQPIEHPESNEGPTQYLCKFDAGEHGVINGQSEFMFGANTVIGDDNIPIVIANKGYKFIGWNISPFNCLMDQDRSFTAQYSKCLPWYKRLWLWLVGLFAGRGCLKWLLWLLLIALGLLLLSLLLKSCNSCSKSGGLFGGEPSVNGVAPIGQKPDGIGGMIDDNGFALPITGIDGKLPSGDGVIAPIMGEDGSMPPVIDEEQRPDVIANRLFLFLEDNKDDIDALAEDFKKKYPDEQYSIIGFDREIGMLVIQIPESERNRMRQSLNDELPNHSFLVFDEEIYELNGTVSNSASTDMGWHIKAINLMEGWKITKGSSNIRIAVVDDGIDAGHPMFKGRIVDAYNVYTQSNNLSKGQGHGTHTAGLAAGSAEFISKGASGVAPNSKIIPIQVFDNNICPLSALVAGVMYAIRHDADVVNLSVSANFEGLNQMPPAEQETISKTQFKNVEKLWSHISKLAVQKKCILVFAAGNNDILASIPPTNRNESSIVVTAVDQKLCPTTFTNFGPGSDISAPGIDIYSSFPTNDFKSMDGTSMAAPIVSGTIALMKSLKKDLSVKQAKNVLYKTGADVYGYIPPMVLVDKALQAVKNNDFGTPNTRELIPVPHVIENPSLDSGNGGHGTVEDTNGSGGTSGQQNGSGSQTKESSKNTDSNPKPGFDEDEIRREIREHQERINELNQLLKNNGRK